MSLIEREAFRSELLSLTYYGDGEYYSGREAERDAIIDRLNEQPTIDAAPVVHGKWMFNGDSWTWDCTNCKGWVGSGVTISRYKFCPNCGARMDGGEGHGL